MTSDNVTFLDDGEGSFSRATDLAFDEVTGPCSGMDFMELTPVRALMKGYSKCGSKVTDIR